jgi:hypothetical protein
MSTIEKKTRGEYALLAKFHVENVENRKLLYRNDKLCPMDFSNARLVIAQEEMFDKLLEIHANAGHKRRDIVFAEASKRFWNISVFVVEQFLDLCEECQLTKLKRRKKQVFRPILSPSFSSRGQVDLL